MRKRSTPEPWKPGELDLRQREVDAALSNAKTQRSLSRLQVISAVISLIAVAAAVFAAYQGYKAVRQSAASNAQQAKNNVTQAEANQVSTAVNALGSNDSAERVAGLLLLRMNAISEISPRPSSSADREKAYNNYVMSLLVLAYYINNYSLKFIHGNADFGLGYGSPPAPGTPLDITQAADEIRILLYEKRAAEALDGGLAPALDLAHDELYKQSWNGVNFSWLSGKFFAHIDLRGSYLIKSGWRKAFLEGAYLQCADLAHANFRGADLRHADLRGADIQGADFTGAHLAGAQINDLYGKAEGPLPVGKRANTPRKLWPYGKRDRMVAWQNLLTTSLDQHHQRRDRRTLVISV